MSSGADTPRQLILWTIAAVAGAVVVLWLLYLAREVLLLLYVSALFAIGFSPFVGLIERQRVLPIGTRGRPRWLAILVVYVGILGADDRDRPLVRQARSSPPICAPVEHDIWSRGSWQPITSNRRSSSTGETDAVGTLLGALWGFLGGIVGVLDPDPDILPPRQARPSSAPSSASSGSAARRWPPPARSWSALAGRALLLAGGSGAPARSPRSPKCHTSTCWPDRGDRRDDPVVGRCWRPPGHRRGLRSPASSPSGSRSST
jgi:hypothetical protein